MRKIMNEMVDVKKNFIYEKGHFLGDPVMSFGKMNTKVAGKGARACLGAEECQLYVDIRFSAGMTTNSIKRDLERIIYNLSIEDPELKATVSTTPPVFGVECLPLVMPRDLPLLKTLELTHKQVTKEDLIVDVDGNGTTTHRVIDWTRYGASDLQPFNWYGVPGINYGPGAIPNTPDERVSIEQLINHCKVSALTMLEICEVA
jgi:acetylornithine deacetylase/succinyl-diaminopimelate desuccinylase-like protein